MIFCFSKDIPKTPRKKDKVASIGDIARSVETQVKQQKDSDIRAFAKKIEAAFVPAKVTKKLAKLFEDNQTFVRLPKDDEIKWNIIRSFPFVVLGYNTYKRFTQFVCKVFFSVNDFRKYRFIARNRKDADLQRVCLLNDSCDRYEDGRRIIGK